MDKRHKSGMFVFVLTVNQWNITKMTASTLYINANVALLENK